MIKGDTGHIAHTLSQQGSNRPLYGYGQYRMPFEKLYLTGASSHPGMGVTGGERAPAMAIMEDLGIDFEKIFVS
ncbi:MAG: hypothetical protein JRJ15_12855 [Deltaproteobacteria bacterium]|nr:hypothetical protein [Deltaproteobacteria bacterium]